MAIWIPAFVSRLELVNADAGGCRMDALTDWEGILIPHLPSLQISMHESSFSDHTPVNITNTVGNFIVRKAPGLGMTSYESYTTMSKHSVKRQHIRPTSQ